MSSDGRRVPTIGWEINSAGQMNLPVRDVVEIVDVVDIEEAPPVSGAAAAKTDPSAATTDPARPRRSTLETFNDEMAVLDRPLEGDVEYFDEKPKSRLRGKASMLVGIIAIGAASGLVFVKMRPSSGAATEASAAMPAAAPAAPAAPSTAIAAAPAEAPAVAAAPDPEGNADEPAAGPADDSAPRASSRTAWTKVHTKTSHSRHERSGGGGKVVHRRTTTVKHHVVKHTVAGRR